MTDLRTACLIASLVPALALAEEPKPPFAASSAVLLNVSERDLNRIVVDSFHANGGPRFEGEKERVSSSVSGLRYRAKFSDPVIRLGKDGTARLSLDIVDASLRIGRLERTIGGVQARCEDAGLEVDPGRPLAVEVALGLTVENFALRINPKSVEIPTAAERLRLVEPARCKNTLLPRWFLWGLGEPYLRRSFGNLDEVILKRAKSSAARLEKKESLIKGWEFPRKRSGDPTARLHLFPETLDMSGGSLFVGLTAANARPTLPAAPARALEVDRPLPSGSFLGLSESFLNEIARRVTADASASRKKSGGNVRKLKASDAVYALVPGLRELASKENVSFEVSFPEAPRIEFDHVGERGPAAQGSDALIRVLLSGMEIQVRKTEGGKTTSLGKVHVDSARMSIVPFANVLGGISFRIVENKWNVSSEGLKFDEDLVAATLQELTFGKIFETSYEPLLLRALHLGDTEFVPQTFTVNGNYLLIGFAEPPPPERAVPSVAAKRTEIPLGSH